MRFHNNIASFGIEALWIQNGNTLNNLIVVVTESENESKNFSIEKKISRK